MPLAWNCQPSLPYSSSLRRTPGEGPATFQAWLRNLQVVRCNSKYAVGMKPAAPAAPKKPLAAGDAVSRSMFTCEEQLRGQSLINSCLGCAWRLEG